MRVKRAQTEAEIDEVRRLFREYEAFLGADLCFQNFEAELAGLPGKYSRPSGDLLIAFDGEMAVGCVAVRRLDNSTCEMKRLFVRPEARGTGLGKRLAREIIETAQELGYSAMRLDTLERLTEAMHLYGTLGFRRVEPYYKNPLPGVAYWELGLGKERTMDQPISRKELLTAAIAGSEPVAKVEIQEVTMNVGVDAPLHLHPCPTMGVVTEGRIAFEIEGEQTQHLEAGDAFYEPANVRVAKFNNEGDVPAKFVVLYLLGEGESETVRVLDK